MKRSAGVTLSAAIVFLGSAVTLLLALLAAYAGLVQGDPRLSFVRPVLLVEAVVLGGAAVLGTATGLDLLRLRRWARLSLLVFAGFLCLTGFMAGAVILVMPIPAPAHAPAGFAQTFTAVRLGIAGFYFLLLALGAWWLYLFTREGVKAQFEGGAGGRAAAERRAAEVARVGVAQGRPVVVTIVAVLLLLGTLNGPAALALGIPAYFLGTLVTGWGAAAFYLGFAVAHLAIGVGLLKLQPWSRLTAIGLYLFGMVNLATMALPGRMDALMEAVWSRFPAALRPPATVPLPPMWIYMVPGAVLMGVIVWLLAREGKAFRRRVRL